MEEKNVKDTLAENTYNFKLSKCTLKTLVVVAIFKMIVLLTVVVYWRILREHKVVHVLEWCSELDIASQGNPGLLGQLIVKTDKNTNRNKACGKLNTMLKTVVNMNIQDSYDSDACPEIIDLDIKAFNCTVAKKVESTLRLNYITSQAKPVSGKNTKVYWRPITHMITRHMTYLQKEGAIYINQSGYYFVSSLLTVRANNMTTTDTFKNPENAIRHVVNVIYHKNGAERVLLENVKTTCELSFGHAEWSSYTGAPFYLNAQDRVYVATSHPYNIISGHGINYLSIHTIL